MNNEMLFDPAGLPATPEARHLHNGWVELGKALDLLPAAAYEARAAIETRRDEYAARLRELVAERAAYLKAATAPIRGRIC